MAYSVRAIGGVGILLAIGAASLGLVWLAAIGAVFCIAFLVAFIRNLLAG
jgi:hypothetical protein